MDALLRSIELRARQEKIQMIIVFFCRRIPSFRGSEGEIVRKGVAGDVTVAAAAVKFRSWVPGGAESTTAVK